MGSLGRAQSQSRGCPYKERSSGHRRVQRMYVCPHEDTGRRRPSASPGERRPENQPGRLQRSRRSSLQDCEQIHLRCFSGRVGGLHRGSPSSLEMFLDHRKERTISRHPSSGRDGCRRGEVKRHEQGPRQCVINAHFVPADTSWGDVLLK